MSISGPSLSSEEIEEFSNLLRGLIAKDLTLASFAAILMGPAPDDVKKEERLQKYQFFSDTVTYPTKLLMLQLQTQTLQLNDNVKGSSSRERIINQVMEEVDKAEFNGVKVLISLSYADKRQLVEGYYDQSSFGVEEFKPRARKPSAPAIVAAPKGLEAGLVKGPVSSNAAAASSSATVNQSFAKASATPARAAAAPAKLAPLSTPLVKSPARAAAAPAKPAPLSTPLVKSPARAAAPPAKLAPLSTPLVKSPAIAAASQAKPAAPSIPLAKAPGITSSSFIMKSPAHAAAKPAAPASKPSAVATPKTPSQSAAPVAKSPPSLIFSKPSAQSLAAEAMAHRLAKAPAPPPRKAAAKAK